MTILYIIIAILAIILLASWRHSFVTVRRREEKKVGSYKRPIFSRDSTWNRL